MSAILEIKGLRKQFGGVTALSSVDLTVNEGEILGVVGPNGSGKTTLFNVVTGVHKPTQGSVSWRARACRFSKTSGSPASIRNGEAAPSPGQPPLHCSTSSGSPRLPMKTQVSCPSATCACWVLPWRSPRDPR